MSKFLQCDWNKIEFSAMESCNKLYTLVNDAILMLLLQLLWKMSQISNYFKEKSESDNEAGPVRTMKPLPPLSKELKVKRHIRSMSDVQSSTPYHSSPYHRMTHRLRKGSNPILTYDSDRTRRQREIDSSDSSDFESAKNLSSLERNILKHTDSMRIL